MLYSFSRTFSEKLQKRLMSATIRPVRKRTPPKTGDTMRLVVSEKYLKREKWLSFQVKVVKTDENVKITGKGITIAGKPLKNADSAAKQMGFDDMNHLIAEQKKMNPDYLNTDYYLITWSWS